MEKIPTAKEFLLEAGFPGHANHGLCPTWMIEFAKLHVEAALKAASESRCINMFDKPWKAYSLEPGTKILDIVNITVNKNLIINSYPLENIK
jgi:hypothetical protein